MIDPITGLMPPSPMGIVDTGLGRPVPVLNPRPMSDDPAAIGVRDMLAQRALLRQQNPVIGNPNSIRDIPRVRNELDLPNPGDLRLSNVRTPHVFPVRIPHEPASAVGDVLKQRGMMRGSAF